MFCNHVGAYLPEYMDKEKKTINYPQKIARILLKTILFLFLFIILIFLLILTPPVQRFMTGKWIEMSVGREIGKQYFGSR